MNAKASWLKDSGGRVEELRSLNVAGAGAVLLQTNINKVVQYLTLREFGAQAVLPRKPGSGDKAYINRRTAGTTGAEWVSDTDAATDEVGTYAQTDFQFRTLLTKGTLTRLLVQRAKTYGDALAIELEGKSEDFAQALEEATFKGDNAVNAKSISGMLTLIGNISGQTIANTTADAGDNLILAKLDETIDQVKGSASESDLIIFGSKAGTRKLNAALQAQQAFNDKVDIGAGFRVRSYDMIPIVKSTSMPDTLVWNGTGARITAFTGGATTALVVANTRYLYYEELTPLTVMPLARTTSQNQSFEIFWDGVLVLSNTFGGAILGGLTV